MLENLYADIGNKIKNWAVWIFIVEALAAIIGGIALMANEFIGVGLLTMIFGPFVAWVSSWLLYAFGQLVEDVHDLRDMEKAKTAPKRESVIKSVRDERNFDEQFAKALNEVRESASKEKYPNKNNAPISAEINGDNKICPQCGTSQNANRRVCWSCGQPFDN